MKKCPFCGEVLTVARSKKYEGFSVKGWEEKCIFCGAVTASSADPESSPCKEAAPASGGSLAALLGEERAVPKTVIKAEGNEGHFCRICRHFLQHPFTPRCGLDNHPVDPMGDCSDFAPAEK